MTPLHTATIAGRPVRFYASPHNGPDWPWVAFRDVLALALLPPDYIEASVEQWRRAWPDMTRDLPDGTTIVPDVCAKGLFVWCAEHAWPPAGPIGRAYNEATSKLFARLHASKSAKEFEAFAQLACLRNLPIIPGVTHAN